MAALGGRPEEAAHTVQKTHSPVPVAARRAGTVAAAAAVHMAALVGRSEVGACGRGQPAFGWGQAGAKQGGLAHGCCCLQKAVKKCAKEALNSLER